MYELVDWQQLNGCHADPLQVLDDGGMRQPGVGAAQLLRYIWVQLGQAFDVNLVEDRVGHRSTRRPVVAPVEVLGNQHRTRHVRR